MEQSFHQLESAQRLAAEFQRTEFLVPGHETESLDTAGKLLFIYCFAHDGPYPHVCPRHPLFLQEQSDSEVEAEEAVLWSRQYTAGDYSAIKCEGGGNICKILFSALAYFGCFCKFNFKFNIKCMIHFLVNDTKLQSSLIEYILRECVMLLHSE